MFLYFNRLLFKSISQRPLFTISRFSLSFLSFPVFFLPASLSVRFLSFPHIFLLLLCATPIFLAILHSCLFLPLFLPILPFFPCFPPSHSTPSYFLTPSFCPPLHFSYLSNLLYPSILPKFISIVHICIVSYLYV